MATVLHPPRAHHPAFTFTSSMPNANGNAKSKPINAQPHPLYARPPPPRVNLAEEEDAADYKPGGYHPCHIMDTFSNGRYLVLRKMGWGHFSTVWLAKDSQTSTHVALKIMKSSRRYTETALDEIKLLRHVQNANPLHPGHAHLVTFWDSFMHMGVHEQMHVCMSFEPLGENLLSLTQRCVKQSKQSIAHQRRLLSSSASPSPSSFPSHPSLPSHLASLSPSSTSPLSPTIDLAVPPHLVKAIAKQILLGLQYLHEECGLIHTDLKPENVLVCLDDVERVVREELEITPTSESIKASTRTLIGIPPGQDRFLQRSPSSLHYPNGFGSNQQQVYIFSSQPLNSPSRTPIGSLQNSPSAGIQERILGGLGLGGLRMSALEGHAAGQVTGMKGKDGILGSSTAAGTTTTTTPTPAIIPAPQPPATPLPTPTALGLGSGSATTAMAKALVTATMLPSTSPGGVSAAEMMMVHARGGSSASTVSTTTTTSTVTATAANTFARPPFVEDDSDSEVDSEPVTPILEGVNAGGVRVSSSVGTTPASSFVFKEEESGDEGEPDVEGETETVLGEEGRESTPLPPPWQQQLPATTSTTTGPSLLSQTAPSNLPSDTITPPSFIDNPIPILPSLPPPPPIRIKIADLGNATPISKKFTNDIQTRQYRSPEAILGMTTWDEKVDVFSVACVVFELLTGEYLFNPKSRSGMGGQAGAGGFTKDDDHMAQIVELMGDGFTKNMKEQGRYSREIWRSNGALRNIQKLHGWPLRSVMMDKYDYAAEDADLFASFLEPMLAIDPKKRARAQDMLDHPWINP